MKSMYKSLILVLINSGSGEPGYLVLNGADQHVKPDSEPAAISLIN